jgi:hypothetical protein
MPIKTNKLAKLCNIFYKKATLEDDMAKRIMLSIIPAVSSPVEMHHTGGFPDYKVLRSAANGAKDLIKYGTRACTEEMSFYGAGFVFDEDDNPPNEDDLRKKKNARLIYERASRAAYSNDYETALKLCLQSFDNLDGWEPSYGGKSWAKIAQTLYDLYGSRKRLETIRAESMTPNRDPKKDYIIDEISEMKNQIVLMNVFDGLAHNTGSIMPKVIDSELFDISRGQKNTDKETQYKQEILRMMDAKEISNPIQVYKLISPIIEKSPQKHLFKDWMRKLHEHPEYTKTEDARKALQAIRVKKQLKERVNTISYIMNDELISLKNRLINTPKEKRIIVLTAIHNSLNHFDYNLLDFIHDLETNAYTYSMMTDALKHISTISNLFKNEINDFRSNLKYTLVHESFPNPPGHLLTDTDITNTLHKLKNDFNKVIVLVDELA